MNIEELNKKHISTCRYEEYGDEGNYKNHTKLSIEFAISVLEEMDEHTQINDKIQELKQTLNTIK